MVDFLRRHWETVQETLNIKNNKDFYGELQTVTTEKPFMKNVLAFIRKQQYLQWWKMMACITQATIYYYPVLLHLENRDSLTGTIRKRFFFNIIASATLKDSPSFLTIYPSCIGQWKLKNLKWDKNVKFIFTIVKDNLLEN